MSIKLQHHSFVSPSSHATRITSRCIIFYSSRHVIGCTEFVGRPHRCSYRILGFQKQHLVHHKLGRRETFLALASTDDGITVDRSAQSGASSYVEARRMKFDQSLQNENFNDGLVQALHDAARVFELSIREQESPSTMSWFSVSWLGVDANSWAKGLSYQACIYSLLQAATEISSFGDGKDRDTNILVQRSLLLLSAPLESVIRESLSTRHPELSGLFWSEQIPVVVATFVNHFEGDQLFSAATVSGKRITLGSSNSSDVSLIMLSLTCTAAITNLGPAKVSCPQFFSVIPDVTAKLMDLLVGLVPIHEAYHSVKEIGLHKEFLVHFGPRVASAGINNDDYGIDEIIFWVDLVQNQLQRAMYREKIWSRLTTSESIEVLERDLAIFGFFIALGRSTQSFLAANGFNKIEEPVEGFIRYLIGGVVLYYPQLSAISSYQLYVEAVCEELEWLPFYPGYANTVKSSHGSKSAGPTSPNMEAVPMALDVGSHWIWSFIKHSKWLQNPSNIKAARFLSKGHSRLKECMEQLGLLKEELLKSKAAKLAENNKSKGNMLQDEGLETFDQALESVEEALVRLENLLQELHVCSSSSEKEQLKAACSDLERIRRLKNEAEFLEASFRAKATSLQQGADDSLSQSSITEQTQYGKGKYRKSGGVLPEKSERPLSKFHGQQIFLLRPLAKKPEHENESFEQRSDSNAGDLDSNEFRRFEVLRSELMELEKRVQQNADQSENEEEKVYGAKLGTDLITAPKQGHLIEKSLNKLKEASMDVWEGTQLLAIDVAAAMGLMRRVIIGDELTEKEKRALRRTLTDLASVIPIGVLMLLPVTAVGHAAMLAAIQKYVPALIPSTYGPERLDLLRKMQKVKETETSDNKFDEDIEELAS